MGHGGREEEAAKWEAHAPQAQSELGGPFLLSLSLFLLLILQLGKGGNLLLLGVGIPLGACHSRPALPSSTPLYTGEGGTP